MRVILIQIIKTIVTNHFMQI